jgi:hypothetical protein
LHLQQAAPLIIPKDQAKGRIFLFMLWVLESPQRQPIRTRMGVSSWGGRSRGSDRVRLLK